MVSMDQALDIYPSPDIKLLIKDVTDPLARKRQVTVRSWSTIKEVKDVLQRALRVPPSAQHLYFGPLRTRSELPNHRSLQDAGIYRSGETLLLEVDSGSGYAHSSIVSLKTTGPDICVSKSVVSSCPKALTRLVMKARGGLSKGLKPELVLDGSGGTYFLKDAGLAVVAVFKPGDEEPYAENNPRGYTKQGCNQDLSLRAGIEPGQSCVREVAAFMLDHGGFSGVPMTTLAVAKHHAFHTNGSMLKVSEGGASLGSHSLNPHAPASSGLEEKTGSLQEFVKGDSTMDDLSPSKLSVDEVHKIAILDIRLMNADRNLANLICRRKPDNSIELVPIDHGYCLRGACDVSWFDWCWLDWPQLKEPLSEKSKAYILNLDIDADAAMLEEKLGIKGKAIDYFRSSSKLLQDGVRLGVSLYDIANMCCREDIHGEVPSKLEVLTSMAYELASSAVENGRWNHESASKALADQLSSPEGGSLLETSVAIVKSMSSCALVSLTSSEEKGELPAMSQCTGGSDTSSESGDTEDCEDWALQVIAGVKRDTRMSIQALDFKPRTNSVCSDTDSASRGFWQTSPGQEGQESDSDSVSWEQDHELTSRNVMDLNKEQQLVVKEVAFQAPASLANSFAGMNLKREESKKPGMNRSQSYSTLSELRRASTITRRASTITNRSGDSRLSVIDESQEYRLYFNKFVDLVIVRETTALARKV